jgi:CubicO group peptidase (beta-lactamase class C family)
MTRPSQVCGAVEIVVHRRCCLDSAAVADRAGPGSIEESVDRVAAATGFSGVVRVDRGGAVLLARAYGWAHRGRAIPNTVDTLFGIASGT